MNVQLGFGVLGNMLLLGIALLEIILDHTDIVFLCRAEGMPLGWCALGLTVAAGAYRAWQRGRKFSPNAVGLDRHERVGSVGLHRAEFAHAGRRRAGRPLGLSRADDRLGELRVADRRGDVVGRFATNAARARKGRRRRLSVWRPFGFAWPALPPCFWA